jgi:raffinose/stachyose/melibiose transport system substrate-binding protein
MYRRSVTLSVAAVLVATLVPACGDDDASGKTKIELFQFKGEAVEIFQTLVDDFEATHPNIDVVLNNVPNADAAIRTRLVRNDVPDVMTLNGSGNFAQLARADVFYDFSQEPVLDTVNPAIVKILTDLGTSGEGEVNGIPFANNADGVIYNKDLFAKYGVEVPTTWDEMIAAADTFKAAGVTPFYITLKDAWTSLPAWNALASNLPPADFWKKVDDGETSFQADYPVVAERLEQLFDYGQEDKFSKGYEDGNRAFAEGDVPMYLQGIWAISAIRNYDPDFEIGTFALPMDTPDDTRLVSGVDVALTMPKSPDHPEESLALIDYLMQPDVVDKYVHDQAAIPTLNGVLSEDPDLAGLLPYFKEQRLVGFTDHQIPASIPLQQINQQFLIDADTDKYLSTLDNEWDKFVARRPEREDR